VSYRRAPRHHADAGGTNPSALALVRPGLGDSGDGLGLDFQSLAIGGAFTIGTLLALGVGATAGFWIGRLTAHHKMTPTPNRRRRRRR